MTNFWLWSPQHQLLPANPLEAGSISKAWNRGVFISLYVLLLPFGWMCCRSIQSSRCIRLPRSSSAGSRHQIGPWRTPTTTTTTESSIQAQFWISSNSQKKTLRAVKYTYQYTLMLLIKNADIGWFMRSCQVMKIICACVHSINQVIISYNAH